MLVLHRIVHFNELLKCQISGEFIYPGDYYYQDTDDGLIVKATVYRRIKNMHDAESFDMSRLKAFESEAEYRVAMKEYTRQKHYESLLKGK